MKINERAALRSASWGLGQIMGLNASLAGIDTARATVERFAEDEEHHLDAMVTFIISAGLDDELRAHDWRGFARGYNGSSYARHGYHTRLEQRFRWWQDRPDTPWSPGMCGSAAPDIGLPALSATLSPRRRLPSSPSAGPCGGRPGRPPP